MCGIAGSINRDWQKPVEQDLLRRMCNAIEHRGPDDEGYYRDGPVGLCMRRLQVIDLAGGHQPMSNEDGSLRLVFNGEIYNYRELREDLAARGHRFKTASDTETILHLYEEKGVDCVDDLRGMFAFALWDAREQSLMLARDRLGLKPLYYAETEQGLSFSSELGSLLCDTAISRELDYGAIDEYLSYLFVPHPRTIFQQASKLPPASRAIFRAGQLQVERYWDVRYDTIAAKSQTQTVEELDELLREAVKIRLLADVPVGAFLSGGLDSSLVVALMRAVSDQPVRTFAIGFAESSFNELTYARQVAEALDTEHREYTVSYDVEELIPKMLQHFGEPFADSSAIPTYHLSRVAREEVTVALSGDGGDEVFGGYRRYQARRWAQAFNALPGRGMCEWGALKIPEPAGYYGKSWRKKMRRFVEFARAVREAPETSWGFFLPKRKKLRCIRKNLPILLVVPSRVCKPILPLRHTPVFSKCCGSI